MSNENSVTDSLSNWINKNIPSWLNEMSERFETTDSWKMPIIEDYVLIFAVKDIEDGGNGVFALANKNAAEYRIRGLLEVAFS
jgi:hypothetical protein